MPLTESVRSQRASLTWLWSCNGVSSSGRISPFKIQRVDKVWNATRGYRGQHLFVVRIHYHCLNRCNETSSWSWWKWCRLKIVGMNQHYAGNVSLTSTTDQGFFRLLLKLASLALPNSIKLSRRLSNNIIADCNSLSNSYTRLQYSQIETDAYWRTLANSTTSRIERLTLVITSKIKTYPIERTTILQQRILTKQTEIRFSQVIFLSRAFNSA